MIRRWPSIADRKQTPGTVGIRITMTQEAGVPRTTRASTASCVPPCGTTCRLTCCAGATWPGTALIDRHPDRRFILDHLALAEPRRRPPAAALGGPAEGAGARDAPERGDEGLPAPARYPGNRILSRRSGAARPRVRCLGVRPLPVGTDWTGAFAVVNYAQALEPFRQTDRLSDSERAMLMGGACAKAYGWSLQKG